MGAHRVLAIGVQQVAPNQHAVVLGPQVLAALGCNLQVEIATATAFVTNATAPAPRKSITVMAHLDTGASMTTISQEIAKHLALVATGIGVSHTANGPVNNPTYAVDLLFVGGMTLGSPLAARTDINVGSCTLPFTLATHAAEPRNPRNFGILIGRDMMSAWHMTWDGPTSTVVISD